MNNVFNVPVCVPIINSGVTVLPDDKHVCLYYKNGGLYISNSAGTETPADSNTVLHVVETVSANTMLFTSVPPSFKLYSVVPYINSGTGTTSSMVLYQSGTTVCNICGPNDVNTVTNGCEFYILKPYFSYNTYTNLYVSASTWGGNTVKLYITMIKTV